MSSNQNNNPKKRNQQILKKTNQLIKNIKKKAEEEYISKISKPLSKITLQKSIPKILNSKQQKLIKINPHADESKIFLEEASELELYNSISESITPLLSKNKDFKIGIALSAGGAKGIAHLGVLRVLEKSNIPISVIAGSSMGSVVGGLYALNPDSSKLAKIVESLNKDVIKNLTKIRVSKESIFETQTMKNLLEEIYSGQSFEDAKIPFYSIAYNIDDLNERTFSIGKLATAIQASSSIPGVFSPVFLEGKHYVDGGISNPLPLSVIKDKCDFLIAVKIPYNFQNDLKLKPKIIDILARSISTMENELSNLSIKTYQPDFLIDLAQLNNYSSFEFDKAKKIVSIGTIATREIIKELALAIKAKIKNYNKKP